MVWGTREIAGKGRVKDGGTGRTGLKKRQDHDLGGKPDQPWIGNPRRPIGDVKARQGRIWSQEEEVNSER